MRYMRIMPIVSVVARELHHGRQIMHAGQGDATDQGRARQSIRAPVGANHHRGQMPTGGVPTDDDIARVATVRGSFTRHPHHRAAALLDDLATVTAGHRS